MRLWPTHAAPMILAVGVCAFAALGCWDGAWSPDGGDDGTPSDPQWSLDADPMDEGETPTIVTEITVSVQLSELIPTVATVEWTLGNVDASRTYVQVGPTTAYGRTLDGVCDDDVCLATVIGLKPSTLFHYRVVAVTEVGLVGTANASFSTGAVPSGLANLTLGSVDDEQASSGYLLTTLFGVPFTIVVLDPDGDYVWWYRYGSGDIKITRAHISRDGEWMLALVELTEPDAVPAESELVRIKLDGSEVQVLPLTDVHHDFVELPGGTLLFLAYDVWTVDGVEVVGDGLVEMGADGDTQLVWSVWEHAAYDETLHDLPTDSWSHANALQYDEASGLVLVSLRNLDSIFAMDRESYGVRWRMGGEESDFKLESGSSQPFEGQHQFHLLEDGLVVFDNRTVEIACSRAVELEMVDGSNVLREVWSHEADPCLFVYALGDVRRLSDGNTLVTWSTAGQAEQVTPDGDVVWRLNTSIGWGFGYASWLPELGGTTGP